jgi:hypothetical protein
MFAGFVGNSFLLPANHANQGAVSNYSELSIHVVGKPINPEIFTTKAHEGTQRKKKESLEPKTLCAFCAFVVDYSRDFLPGF